MQDINDLTAELVDEVQVYLDEAPIDLSGLVFTDELYERCYQEIFSKLADIVEAKVEEDKLKDYDDE